MLSILIIPLISIVNASAANTLQFSGVVQSSIRVKINHEVVAGNLDLKTSQADLKIATIKEDSASLGGFKVTITSLNHGDMIAENAPKANTHTYKIKYNGKSIHLENHSGTTIHSTVGSFGKQRDLTISYDASTKLINDSYSDTLKLSYAAN